MKKRFLTLIITLTALNINGQTSYQSWPEIGKKFTDFELDSVANYYKKTISFNDFKGKWVILDFWGEHCSGCIASFPKINSIQKKFHKEVQFILITKTYRDPFTAIDLFNKLKNKFDLDIPVTYDQTFLNRIGPLGFPTIILINPNGVVRAITDNISEENVVSLLNNGNPSLSRTYLSLETKPNAKYNPEKPMLINENGGSSSKYLYRSIMTTWDSLMPGSDIFIRPNRIEVFKAGLKRLFLIAYFGKDSWVSRDKKFYGNYYPKPILSINDSTLFHEDFSRAKNLFCYSLSFSENVYSQNNFYYYTLEDKPKLMKWMQNDLQNYFGYVGLIEAHKMPYYKLIATKEAQKELLTKGSSPVSKGLIDDQRGFLGKNLPIKEFIGSIITSIGYPTEFPLIDETGIAGNIDITIDAIYFDDWLTELRKNGLDLIVGEKEMKVLVIRDAKIENN